MALSSAAAAELLNTVKDLLGDECQMCGARDNHFHLHHVEYGTDSVPADAKGQWATVLRRREALAHPERFEILCRSCHLATEAYVQRLRKLTPEQRAWAYGLAERTVRGEK